MKLLTTTKKKIAAVAVAGGMIATTGIAYAYWTTEGSGSGAADVAEESNNDLVLTADFADGLVPGDTVDVDITAENIDEQTSQKVGTVAATVATDNVNCLPAWFVVGTITQHRPIVAPEDSELAAETTLTFTNEALVDQDACKGAEVTLNLTSSLVEA